MPPSLPKVDADERLVPENASLDALKPGHPHRRCREERPSIYPERRQIPDAKVSWTFAYPEYDTGPPFDAPKLQSEDRTRNPAGWADPPDVKEARALRELRSAEPTLFDASGMPLNPRGRTGLSGRGQLGNFGANFAADAFITRINRKSRVMEMIAVQRKDNGQWAIPGGMVDVGEDTTVTASRELREEAGVALDLHAATVMYRGYCDDRRNTDNAWMETSVFHLHLDGDLELKLKAGDDAAKVRWLPLTRENVASLYASHSDFVREAVRQWEKATGFVVRADGKVVGS